MCNILIPLTLEQIERRYKEIGTSEEDVESSLKILKDWYMEQPHLPKRYGGTFLRTFLVGCENRIEEAKEKIDKFFYYRSLYPKYLLPHPVTDPSQKAYFFSRCHLILPKCTPEGHRVMIHQPDNDLTREPCFELNVLMLNLETLYLQDETSGGGIIIIDDFKYFTSFKAVVRHMTLMKYYAIVQEITPLPVKKIVFVNCGKFLEKMTNVLQKLMNGKVDTQFSVISKENSRKLFDLIPKDILPLDYGGLEESSESLKEKYHQKMIKMHDWFEDTDNSISNESKRIFSPERVFENMFGDEGSFKCLNFD